MAIQVLFLALGLLALFALAKHLLQIRAANKKSSQWRSARSQSSYSDFMSRSGSEAGMPEDGTVAISSQYGSMLITQALLKSRQSMNRLRPRLQYADAGRGIFAQSDPSTDDRNFNYLKCDFGLVMKGSWPSLKNLMADLNQSCHEDYAERLEQCPLGGYEEHQVRYKVLFLARHGQGYHNLAIEIYGEEEWENYWSKLNGDGNIVWGPDPELTPLGTEQAKRNNIAWKKQIEKQIPLPQAFYVSPFTRATDTYQHTWDDIEIPTKTRSNSTTSNISSSSTGCGTSAEVPGINNMPPLIVEDIRETIGMHTCDMRNTKTFIHNRHPTYNIEKGFTEEDELWTSTHRETPAEQNVRIRRFLDNLFESDWDTVPSRRKTFVSVTAHSGVIKSFLDVIGHRPFQTPTGSMIPVVVKAIRKEQF